MVEEKEWNEKMQNLLHRRRTGTTAAAPAAFPTYGELINKCFIGNRVLDVGCGSMAIRNFLPEGTMYKGIDAFPVSEEVEKMKIEDCDYPDLCFDTVYCFAVLDGVQDVKEALRQMKRVCQRNVVILTGIDIEPDQYHTHKITEEYLLREMKYFKMTFREEIKPKVFLYEFRR